MDALVSEIVGGTNPTWFDLTGAGTVNQGDLTLWLANAGTANLPSGNPYLPGDANLDGSVDGSDFGIWNANKFTSVAAWCSGDFTADGSVDGSDFGIWNSNKFQSSEDLSTVPEPSSVAVLIPVLFGTFILNRARVVRRTYRSLSPGCMPG